MEKMGGEDDRDQLQHNGDEESNEGTAHHPLLLRREYHGLQEACAMQFKQLSGVPASHGARHAWKPYFITTLRAYAQLWKYQQRHRQLLLDHGIASLLTIGETASKIAQLYSHFYSRTSSVAHLQQAQSYYAYAFSCFSKDLAQTGSSLRSQPTHTAPPTSQGDGADKYVRFLARYASGALLLLPAAQPRTRTRTRTEMPQSDTILEPSEQSHFSVRDERMKGIISTASMLLGIDFLHGSHSNVNSELQTSGRKEGDRIPADGNNNKVGADDTNRTKKAKLNDSSPFIATTNASTIATTTHTNQLAKAWKTSFEDLAFMAAFISSFCKTSPRLNLSVFDPQHAVVLDHKLAIEDVVLVDTRRSHSRLRSSIPEQANNSNVVRVRYFSDLSLHLWFMSQLFECTPPHAPSPQHVMQQTIVEAPSTPITSRTLRHHQTRRHQRPLNSPHKSLLFRKPFSDILLTLALASKEQFSRRLLIVSLHDSEYPNSIHRVSSKKEHHGIPDIDDADDEEAEDVEDASDAGAHPCIGNDILASELLFLLRKPLLLISNLQQSHRFIALLDKHNAAAHRVPLFHIVCASPWPETWIECLPMGCLTAFLTDPFSTVIQLFPLPGSRQGKDDADLQESYEQLLGPLYDDVQKLLVSERAFPEPVWAQDAYLVRLYAHAMLAAALVAAYDVQIHMRPNIECTEHTFTETLDLLQDRMTMAGRASGDVMRSEGQREGVGALG